MKGKFFKRSSHGFNRKQVIEYIKELDNETVELSARLSECETRCDEMRAENDREIKQVVSEFEGYKASVDARIQRAEALEKQNEALRAENEALKSKIENMEKNQAAIFAKNSKLYSGIKEVGAKAPAKLGVFLKTVRNDAAAEKDKIIELYRKELAKAKRELEELKKRLYK
ncbi:MAG: hypothetical protein IKA51_06355 [Clostridia bacterium]|nr:hypothetical protein [Clostridia bacterium]